MKIKKNIISIIFLFILFTGINLNVIAQEDYKILQSGVHDGKIVSYIEVSTNISEIECQIGMTPIEEIEVAEIGTDSFHTIVLVDNSLSVTEENTKKINELLEKYISNKKDNEYISIAAFGEEIQFFAERIQEQDSLLEAIAKIEANNQDTYLTDILYEILDDINVNEYTRFLIITDGVDNKQIGITKEELIEKLKSNTHPIYAIGHVYKENDSQLENFFALARLTGGKEILLDDIAEIDSIISEINDVSNVVKVNAVIPQELMDGSEKSVLFSLTTENTTSELIAEIRLPFSIREEEVVETIVEESTEEETIVEEPVTEEPVTEEPTIEDAVVEEESPDYMKYILGLVILLALILLIVLNKKNKGGKEKKEKQEKTVEVPIVKEEKEEDIDYDKTVIMDGRYLLVLKDIQDNSKVFKYPMDEKVIIGRNVDKAQIVIDYNRAVSGQHCEVYTKNNGFFIKDLNSANHTYVNNKKCIGETEIFSGNIIKLGDLEFRTEIIPI